MGPVRRLSTVRANVRPWYPINVVARRCSATCARTFLTNPISTERLRTPGWVTFALCKVVEYVFSGVYSVSFRLSRFYIASWVKCVIDISSATYENRLVIGLIFCRWIHRHRHHWEGKEMHDQKHVPVYLWWEEASNLWSLSWCEILSISGAVFSNAISKLGIIDAAESEA